MRYFAILLAVYPAAAFAQPAAADSNVLQALLSEVQQLRMAIERSTLLGTRTQLAISQLQLQESRSVFYELPMSWGCGRSRSIRRKTGSLCIVSRPMKRT